MIHVLVELDNGEQSFFDSPVDAFLFAREAETKKKNSVEYIAIGDFYTDTGTIYRGQRLRHMLRSFDLKQWLRQSMVVDQDAEDIV